MIGIHTSNVHKREAFRHYSFVSDRADGVIAGFDGVEVMEADLLSSTDGPAGRAGIDHVVQAAPAGRMDGFVLFWRALFGLVPQPQLETPAPF